MIGEPARDGAAERRKIRRRGALPTCDIANLETLRPGARALSPSPDGGGYCVLGLRLVPGTALEASLHPGLGELVHQSGLPRVAENHHRFAPVGGSHDQRRERLDLVALLERVDVR